MCSFTLTQTDSDSKPDCTMQTMFTIAQTRTLIATAYFCIGVQEFESESVYRQCKWATTGNLNLMHKSLHNKRHEYIVTLSCDSLSRVPTFFIPSDSLIFPWLFPDFLRVFPDVLLSFHQHILVTKNHVFFLDMALVTLVYPNIPYFLYRTPEELTSLKKRVSSDL